ncbi:cell division protein ZapE [Gordonia sp. NPDC003376]
MCWSLRSQATPRSLSAEDFLAAADRDGLTLDDSQWRAVDSLVGPSNVYLTGAAGRGKTWLLDALAGLQPARSALRLHWHGFVRDLHLLIRDRGGLAAALDHLLVGRSMVCFDELLVDDRADGIFLHALIDRMIRRNIRFVITSNVPPEGQMPSPLLHSTFLPTIDLLENHCSVVELDGGVDYRDGADHAHGFSSGQWVVIERERPAVSAVEIDGRRIRVWESGSGHLGVGFDEICGRPLGASDYLALARRHATWTISGVRSLAAAGSEPARRFVYLIDVLYDHDVPTTIESPVPRNVFEVGVDMAGRSRLLSRLSALRS